jgi:hypothetical protein
MQITTTLTQEQLWGVQYVLQYVANPAIEQENERITLSNQNKSIEEQEPLKPLYTEESYINFVIGVATDDYYKQLLKYKENSALSMFNGLSAEEQAALVAQLNIPDVLQGE